MRTISAARIWPPVHWAQSREASTTGSPKQSPSSRTTSPPLRPARNPMVCGDVRFARSVPCCIATAHAIALAAEVKRIMIPSPRFLISSPPCSVTASRRTAKCCRRVSSAASGGMPVISRVESTMSVKRRTALSDASTGIAPTRLHASPDQRAGLAGDTAGIRGGPTGQPHRTGAASYQVLPATRSPSTRPPRASRRLQAAPGGGLYWLPSCMIGNPHYLC